MKVFLYSTKSYTDYNYNNIIITIKSVNNSSMYRYGIVCCFQIKAA